jgi:hypothetical protein
VVEDRRCEWCGRPATQQVEVLPAKKSTKGFKAAVIAWACLVCAQRFQK